MLAELLGVVEVPGLFDGLEPRNEWGVGVVSVGDLGVFVPEAIVTMLSGWSMGLRALTLV